MSDNRLHPGPWLPVHREMGVSAPPFDNKPLGTYVEEHASQRPKSIALQFFDREINHEELNRLANQLANSLVELGVDKRDVIGLHMPNIPHYCIALVAIAKIGCSGSGVSPLLAPGELAHQLQDAEISVLLTVDSLLPVFKAMESVPACLQHLIVAKPGDFLGGTADAQAQIAAIQTHDYLDLTQGASDQFAQRLVDWNDRFMIQYTGGTTGKPKGAQLSVRNLLHNSDQVFTYEPGVIGGEVFASAFPMFHAAGLFVHLTSMKLGARAMLIPNPRDVAFFCKQMTRFPPTQMAAVPTLYMMLVNAPESGEVDFTQLKTALTGAAPLPAEDRKKIEGMVGKGLLCDVFGMTETGPVHLYNPPGRTKSGSVGIPVPGAETRIVDLETGKQEMPVGEPGEIITTGPQVMLGYLNLPEESDNAMRQWQGRTWMYTGDVGYMDEEGYVFLCDRAKDMLIVGGFKVFSVEVEDKLKALDFVAESAVIGSPDQARHGNDIVNLFVQLTDTAREESETELAEKIIDYCRTNLSPFKVPKRIHFVDEIPLTAVGKIDKKVLRQQLANSG